MSLQSILHVVSVIRVTLKAPEYDVINWSVTHLGQPDLKLMAHSFNFVLIVLFAINLYRTDEWGGRRGKLDISPWGGKFPSEQKTHWPTSRSTLTYIQFLVCEEIANQEQFLHCKS